MRIGDWCVSVDIRRCIFSDACALYTTENALKLKQSTEAAVYADARIDLQYIVENLHDKTGQSIRRMNGYIEKINAYNEDAGLIPIEML